MREKITETIRWLVNRMPEILLGCFLAGVLPLLYLVGRALVQQFRLAVADAGEYFGRIALNPWPCLTALVSIAGSVFLVVVLWRSRTLIWAVARKMIAEAISRRVVLALVIFFIVLMPSLPFLLETEGTLKSQVQIVLTYSLALAMVLLSLIAIFVSAASICSEVEKKHVQITDTKPLQRWHFLAGKLAGVLIMCAALLFVMSASSYFLVRYMARERKEAGLTKWESAKRKREREKVSEEVFVTRVVRRPRTRDADEEVERRIKLMGERTDAAKELHDVKRMRRQLKSQFEVAAGYVAPGNVRRWGISGLEPRRDDKVYLRFKMFPTGGGREQTLEGLWTFWAAMPAEQSAEGEKSEGGARPILWKQGAWPSGTVQEIPIPSETVGPDGVLRIQYQNLEQRTGVYFALDDGLSALQKSESFLPNYYRALVVLLAQVAVLAALGLMAGALFSFPVATLTVFFVFVTGLLGPWFVQIMASGAEFYTKKDVPEAVAPYLNALASFVIKVIVAVMPHFGKFSPIGSLVNGEAITWAFVGNASTQLFFIRAGVALLIGVYFYSRRELARIIL